jgi:DNA-binding transcriptional regulator YiaG
MSTKKTPSVAEQVREGAAELGGWIRGDTRFRVTVAGKDGSRETFHATHAELAAIKKQRAEALKEIRGTLHMSQDGFARLLHVAPGTLKGWEIARRAVPEHVYRLAELARDIPAARAHLEATAADTLLSAGGRPKAKRSTAGPTRAVRSQATKKRAAHA